MVGVEPAPNPPPRPPAAPAIQQTNGNVGLVAAGALRKEGVSGADNPVKSQQQAKWPLECSILLLVQFLERLAFHSLKGVLLPHLVSTLRMDPSSANAKILLAAQITFFTPIFGSVLADAKSGKYGVLLSLFPLYLVSQLLFTVSPILPGPQFLHPYVDLFAMFLLFFCCGGCRAILPAYGADQIWPPSVPQLGMFFALFYAAEQLAIIAALVLVPKVQGMALGPLPVDKPLLAVLSLSLISLWLAMALIGSNARFRKITPSSENVFRRSYRTIKMALYNKRRYSQRRVVLAAAKNQKNPPPKSLLDHFLDDHNCERDRECDFGRKQVCGQAKFLGDLKVSLRVALVLTPLAFFWAFQLQVQPIWAVQAQSINPALPFLGPILPSVSLIQNVLVLLLVPFFYLFIYPSPLSQLCLLNTYLKRMSAGLFLCAIACAVSASVQSLLNSSPSPPLQPPPNSASFKVFNIFPADCVVSISRMSGDGQQETLIPGNGSSHPAPIWLTPGEVGKGYADWLFKFKGPSCSGHRKNRIRLGVTVGKLNYAIVGPQGILSSAMDVPSRAPPGSAQSSIGFHILLPCNFYDVAPPECANASQDPLNQALTPFASALSLCPSQQAAANDTSDGGSNNDTSAAVGPVVVSSVDAGTTVPPPGASSNDTVASSNDTSAMDNSASTASAPPAPSSPATPPGCASWNVGDVQPAQLFVFPPRGDNLGAGSASVYSPLLVPAGFYTLSSPPATDGNSTNSGTTASVWASLPDIQIDDSGGISLMVLSLDGSPLDLSGQNVIQRIKTINQLSPKNTSSGSVPSPVLTVLPLSGPSTLSVVYLVPQYMLMAASEVLLCITALCFCYIQAPTALKATMIAYWYLMIYIGGLLVPLLGRPQISPDPMIQLFCIALSQIAVGAIFAAQAHFFYKYKENLSGESAAPDHPKRKEAQSSGFAERLEEVRASIARIPRKRVARL